MKREAASDEMAQRLLDASRFPCEPHHAMAALDTTGKLIGSLALRTMFMRPAHLCRSAWLEHIPFAFWLVEAHQPRVFVELGAHKGASYFAFCQAVDRLGLSTKCFAVDTWKGDEHAGFYEEDVFEAVHVHNEAHYSRFSRLVRSTFDEATEHFSDGTVDLLHIDGLHLFDAVRHDFESWLPKLSDRAVVVLHDSNVRERQFGVYRLAETLRETYPSFEFTHGHGLTVLGVGPRQTELVTRLFEAGEDVFARRTLHEVFSCLGHACADAHAAEHGRIQAHELRAEAARKDQEASRTRKALEAARGDVDTHNRELGELGTKLQEQTAQLRTLEESSRAQQRKAEGALAAAREEAAAEKTAREKAEGMIVEEIARVRQELSGFQGDLRARDAEIAKLTCLLRQAEEASRTHQKAEEASRLHQRKAEEALATARQGFAHMLGNAVRAVGGYTAEVPPKRWVLRKLARKLREAGVVDADWYLSRNDDVAKAGIDPAEHYILHGIAEGREPSDLTALPEIRR